MGQQLAGAVRGAGNNSFVPVVTKFSKIFRFSKMSHEKSIYLLQVIFIFQLPYRTGNTSTQARINIEQNIEQSLIQISRYRFSLVIVGLTKMLQRVNEIVSGWMILRRQYKICVFSVSTDARLSRT